VKALKSYTYLDQAPIQTIDVRDGLESTLIILRSKLNSANIRIERQYAADLPTIEAHGSELNQVWTNLIDNAIDAMNGNGTLTLRTRADGASVVIEVEDSGPGIPADVRAKIFDPFFTTKPVGKGTGLGLSISYNIVTQKHKGDIQIISEPGQTRFVVRLPVRLASADAA
jgi:signal transduction histidine kinase